MEESTTSLQVPLLPSQPHGKEQTYLDTNIFDNYLLFWVGKIIDMGKRITFQQDMHWKLRQEESSHHITAKLSAQFQRLKNKKEPLLKALAFTTKGIFIKAAIISLISGVVQYSSPLLIREIITYITEGEKDIATGIWLVLGLIVARIIVSVTNARSEILLTILGINTSNAVNGLVYEKTLKFSIIRSVDHSQGSLINHLQVDSEKLYYLGVGIGGAITLPVIIGVGIYFMWAAAGLSFLSGIGVLIIMSGLNFVVGKKFFNAQKEVMTKKDARMKLSTEILNGIKYIKMSGWEEPFLQRIYNAREDELKWLKKQFFARCWSVFLLWLIPMLITTAIFGTYIFTGHDMTATTAFILVSTVNILQYPLSMLPDSIALILESKVALNRVTKFLLAEEVKLDYIKTGSTKDSDVAIKVQNGNFYWLTEEEKKLKKEKEKEEKEENEGEDKKKEKKKKKDKQKKVTAEEDLNSHNDSLVISSELPQNIDSFQESNEIPEKTGYRLILEDINLEVKKGSFVAILGDVGSGKSSFLFSLVGEMKYNEDTPPEVEINGQISYVTQQPWILNTTVKENIIFGNELDETRYQDAIKYSCLQSDLDILIHKDDTEIGEKGVNLSGGQKARVSLARALYRDSDIYLLDDPLSAVDAHVGNFILKECFADYLANKTRVLVTHKFESLKYVDHIYIFQKGRIVEQGTLEGLKESAIFKEIEEKYKMISKNEDKDEAITEESVQIDKLKQIELVKKKSSGRPKEVASAQEKQDSEDLTEEEDTKLQEKLMLEEDREKGDLSWSVWKSFFRYYGGYFYFFLIFAVMFIWDVLNTGSNFWLAYWSDNADTGTYSKGFYFEIYSVLGLSNAFFCLIRVAMLCIQSIKCARQVHKDMISKIIRAPVNLFFDRVPTGRLLNRLSKDLTVLDNYLALLFGSILLCFYCLLADIVVCLIFGTYWILPLAVLFFFVAYRFQRSYMKVNREVVRLESISKSPIVSFFGESLTGLSSVRAYHEQDKFLSKFHTLQDANIKNLILSSGLNNWFNLRVTFCVIFVLAPAVGIPLLVTSNIGLTAGIVGLLVNSAVLINDDIMWLLHCFSYFESRLISLERCRALTQIEGEAPHQTKNKDTIENYKEHWPLQGAIDFKNYYVKYRPNLPHVIKNLTVQVNHGEKIGIVGRTGSGKSTIFLSLLRIIESSEGKIYIDGVDTSKLGLDELRRKITIIPQDPLLFQGTLRSNVDLLNQYTDEEIWKSLENVCLKEKFEQESQLDTEIKEGGENLSAGEKQLLCIGRAILAQNKIILIDEATSNIDPKTEQTILETINNSFKDCTVITVAHRLKTVINSDRILVMDQGELVEYDKPQSLIDDKNSRFHKLWMEYEHSQKDTFE